MCNLGGILGGNLYMYSMLNVHSYIVYLCTHSTVYISHLLFVFFMHILNIFCLRVYIISGENSERITCTAYTFTVIS